MTWYDDIPLLRNRRKGVSLITSNLSLTVILEMSALSAVYCKKQQGGRAPFLRLGYYVRNEFPNILEYLQRVQHNGINDVRTNKLNLLRILS